MNDLVLITGVGKAQQNQNDENLMGNRSELDIEEDDFFSKEDGDSADFPPVNKKTFGTTALREYVRQLLRDDFHPPIYSSTPNLAAGIVQIEKGMMRKWIDSQKEASK